ncbi:GNAT family N-acetyltransferase [Bacillus sp. 165]|nr:GNAT family N-acetyltransferase [Bacillus sp. 165]
MEFARVVTDFVRFAWLSDVFILPVYRGKGLRKWLVQTIVEHPRLQGTRFLLATADAHGLYAPRGFNPLEQPEMFMERKSDVGKCYMDTIS